MVTTRRRKHSPEFWYKGGFILFQTAPLPSIVVNDPGEESLMDILSRGGFQAAVLSDTGSHSIPSPGAKTWSDSPASSYNYAVSRSNSRASSRAQSPGSGTNLESPQMHVNVIDSPLGSPQVSPQHLYINAWAYARISTSANSHARAKRRWVRAFFASGSRKRAGIRYAAEITTSPLNEIARAVTKSVVPNLFATHTSTSAIYHRIEQTTVVLLT